jgi:hypothetical protein
MLSIDQNMSPDEDNKLTLVMVGTDSEGNDMYEGELMEMSSSCPVICPAENPLNTEM